MANDMVTVSVTQDFHAAPEVVFRLVSDHETFLRGPGIRSCRLQRPGTDDRNGTGAVREIHGLGLRFVEDITAFSPPHSYEYKVRRFTVPAEHDRGWLTFAPHGTGTRVVWQTRYRITGPLGPLLTRLSQPLFRTMFGGLLRRAAQRV